MTSASSSWMTARPLDNQIHTSLVVLSFSQLVVSGLKAAVLYHMEFQCRLFGVLVYNESFTEGNGPLEPGYWPTAFRSMSIQLPQKPLTTSQFKV